MHSKPLIYGTPALVLLFSADSNVLFCNGHCRHNGPAIRYGRDEAFRTYGRTQRLATSSLILRLCVHVFRAAPDFTSLSSGGPRFKCVRFWSSTCMHLMCCANVPGTRGHACSTAD